ncbi:hypothetical protein EVAR_43885_1 [Eumeta japonica]|uniref:Uncharacterized protein n=1 Tax=Eumeta variegata TaxID=151549 RepID=A0A4C1WRE6_EUMVA|nr:hypothetical protein EVAR_43885_1 [Eumeta japonica]
MEDKYPRSEENERIRRIRKSILKAVDSIKAPLQSWRRSGRDVCGCKVPQISRSVFKRNLFTTVRRVQSRVAVSSRASFATSAARAGFFVSRAGIADGCQHPRWVVVSYVGIKGKRDVGSFLCLFVCPSQSICSEATGSMEPKNRSCAAAVSLLLGRVGRWSGREIARSALSAQVERDNESCFFVRAAGVHRLIRRTESSLRDFDAHSAGFCDNAHTCRVADTDIV